MQLSISTNADRKLRSVTWYQSYKGILFPIWSFKEVEWSSTELKKVRERIYIIYLNLDMFFWSIRTVLLKMLTASMLRVPSLAFLVDSKVQPWNCLDMFRCTSTVSAVLLLISTQKKPRPISPFHHWQPTWLLAFTMLRPLRASRSNCWYK